MLGTDDKNNTSRNRGQEQYIKEQRTRLECKEQPTRTIHQGTEDNTRVQGTADKNNTGKDQRPRNTRNRISKEQSIRKLVQRNEKNDKKQSKLVNRGRLGFDSIHTRRFSWTGNMKF